MPPKTKKKVATPTIAIVAADGPADGGPATVRFPYTGAALESATKVDIEYTAVVCARLLGCTECAGLVDGSGTNAKSVDHLTGVKLPVGTAILQEGTEAPKVRYTEHDGKVYLRATLGETGAWTLVGKAEHTGVTEP